MDLISPEKLSPDGRFAVGFNHFEMRMSHWVDAPVLFEVENQRVLLDLRGTFWSADRVEWVPDGPSVTLNLRRYPGDKPGATLVVYLLSGEAEALAVGTIAHLALAEVENWLEAYYQSGSRRRQKGGA